MSNFRQDLNKLWLLKVCSSIMNGGMDGSASEGVLTMLVWMNSSRTWKAMESNRFPHVFC
jgi:hypothetical protein